MSVQTWRALIDSLCKLALIPNPQTLYERTALQVNGVEFSLVYSDGAGAGNVLLYGDMGPLPVRARDAVAMRLLEMNFELSGDTASPAFSLNPQSQRVSLSVVLLLERMSAERLLEVLGHLADMALAWRRDFFLDAPKGKAAPTQPINTRLRG